MWHIWWMNLKAEFIVWAMTGLPLLIIAVIYYIVKLRRERKREPVEKS